MKRLTPAQILLEAQLTSLGLHYQGGSNPPEYRFAAPARQWRADYYLSAAKNRMVSAEWDVEILIEIEGGVWTAGRHTRGKGYTEDCRKYNAAAILGFTLLRFTTQMVMTGEAETTIKGALHLT